MINHNWTDTLPEGDDDAPPSPSLLRLYSHYEPEYRTDRTEDFYWGTLETVCRKWPAIILTIACVVAMAWLVLGGLGGGMGR